MSVLLGVGRSLQQPYIQEGQTLSGARLSRLFSLKIIWLQPVQDLLLFSQQLITDMLPVRQICTAYYYLNEGIYEEYLTLA